ncbi:MAG: valine--tRNA ligase [Phycisphaerales bacterium]|nr:valine--tRNA ligase [Phycisphaerales bacterium]
MVRGTDTAIPRSYAPAEAEHGVLQRWLDSGIFRANPAEAPPRFCIVIPPPNVTAPLHLGHALNNTVQDILVRWHRMRGDDTLWMPGTDHAGIATQTVVEKRLLQSEGKKRTDYDRGAFVERVQAWKDEYEETIIDQLKCMGASCDWDRLRFTMDDVCTTAVRAAFFQLFREGLVYRGKRLVNWDPVTRTALADDEVEMESIAGHMYYLRYPLEDGSGHVTVATTRPETMLGDTAVAINPSDPRAAELHGRKVMLPIVDRVIPIVQDDHVVMPGSGEDPKAEFATGFLKVTPAHDPNDWDIGERHDLPVINVMAPDGSISDSHGWEDVSKQAAAFLGMSREDARIAIVDWFKGHDLLEDIRPYEHTVGHSYRSHVPIEPYLSDQWYVAVTDDRLKNEALRAMASDQFDGSPPPRACGDASGDGELRFHPARYARTFQTWHENLRDWCISRQLWWGHRIPVWSKTTAIGQDQDWPDKDSPWIAERHVDDAGEGVRRTFLCVADGHLETEEAIEKAGFVRDEDVLDTWFSSALWPLSTMGWPDPAAFPETEGLLDAFNPSDVLCTAREIITLWVSRMVMFNRYFRRGDLPFRDVYIHPMVQDGFGQKMSKSLGNGVDPRDIIASHGTDALRLVMAQIATTTQDVRLPVDLIDPHTGEAFTPKFIDSPTGRRVAAPIQKSPSKPGAEMVTVYGVSIGEEPTDTRPLAANTSSRFDAGRNFANKLWNASRFALSTIDQPTAHVDGEDRPEVDQWILARLAIAIERIDAAFASFQFNHAADAVYDLIWRDFCDWYLEAIKPTIRDDPQQQRVLATVLDAIVRLLHPICPFVTETIWQHIRNIPDGDVSGILMPPSELAAIAAWPRVENLQIDDAAVASFQRLQELVTAIRTARSQQQVPPRRTITLALPDALLAFGRQFAESLSSLAGVADVCEIAGNGVAIPFEGTTVELMNLHDAVDLDAERSKLSSRIEEIAADIANYRKRLDNDSYVQNAPPHVVQETREQLQAAEQDLAAAEKALAAMETT